MSQEQADAALGKLVRERSDKQKHLALLQAEARELSKLFTGLGQIVQPENVWNISLESYEKFLGKETYEKIGKLRVEIRQTEQNLQTLDGQLKKFDA